MVKAAVAVAGTMDEGEDDVGKPRAVMTRTPLVLKPFFAIAEKGEQHNDDDEDDNEDDDDVMLAFRRDVTRDLGFAAP